MKVGYYPGCSLMGTAKPYDTSTRYVCQALGLELEESPDWTCCGASPALKMNNLLSVSLAARNLALIEKNDVTDVVAPCPFCSRRLKNANEELDVDPELKKKVHEVTGLQIAGKLSVHNLFAFIRSHVGLEAIISRVRMPLKNMKVIPYYGCYVAEPGGGSAKSDPKNPTGLDEIMRALGATVLDWDFKTECCGAALALTKTEKVLELSSRIIREAEWRGAELIVVVCPLCQANLDTRQGDINARQKTRHEIPVVYFTQLMGLAMGLSPSKLELNHHMIDPLPVLRKKGFLA